MAEARSRGYFGIGVEGVSKSANVGALLRTAHAFGAAFCFIVGAGFDARAGRLADTADTAGACAAMALPDRRGAGCAAALRAGGRRTAGRCDRSALVPPSGERCLCARPGAIRPVARHAARCRHVVRIPTRFALNLAVAGALVLYDRLLQHGRFAERPVGSRGAAASRRCRPDTARRAFVATSRPGWQARPSHDPSALVASDLAPYLSRHAPDRGFARSRPFAVPAGAQAQPKPAKPAKPAAAVRGNSASSMTGSRRRIRSWARPRATRSSGQRIPCRRCPVAARSS